MEEAWNNNRGRWVHNDAFLKTLSRLNKGKALTSHTHVVSRISLGITGSGKVKTLKC